MESFRDVSLANKTVLLRADLNVPIHDGLIQDDKRIKSLLPTIELLKQKKAKIILASHLGRPDGKIVPEFSLQILIKRLEEIYQTKIRFIKDFNSKFEPISHDEIILLENLRFDSREETNNIALAQSLAKLADVYINDAFSCSHRAHASIVGVPKFLPSYSGLLLEKEVNALKAITENIEGPLVAIIAGKKVSTKFDILTNLANKADAIIVGGAMANTFLKAKGENIGGSFIEEEFVEKAKQFLETTKCNIILPSDFVCAEKINNTLQNISVLDLEEIKSESIILDLGPKSCSIICEPIKEAKTLIWNGPLGFYEDPRFKGTTDFITRFVAKVTRQGSLISIAGGGDIIAAIESTGLAQEFSYISTAGGAFLEWLEGKSLPGIAAL